MQIRRLVITPLDNSCKKLVDTFYPSTERAQMLITERIECASKIYNDTNKLKIFRKIPKIIKNFVNPKTKVIIKS